MGRPRKIPVDMANVPVVGTELTEQEQQAIEAEARAEFEKEVRVKKRTAYKELQKKKLQEEALFAHGKDDEGDMLDTVTLDLSPVQPYIQINGERYYSGRTYTKKRGIISVLKDQMYRGWKAEAERLGEKPSDYMQRQKVLGNTGLRTY